MTLRKFVRENRAELDSYIRRLVPNIKSLNDAERVQWVQNDERLYHWARGAGWRG